MSYKLPKDTQKQFSKSDNFNLFFNKYRKWDDKVKDLSNKIDFSNFKAYNEKFQAKIENSIFYFNKNDYSVKIYEGKCDRKIIIGLGCTHVAETAMTLHHIYGVPYIPASGIKGALRNMFIQETFEKIDCEEIEQIAICEKVLESFDLEKDINLNKDKFKKKFKVKKKDKRIEPVSAVFKFFSENASIIKQFQLIFGTQSKQGKVVFLEAYPVEDIKIKNDIMTPHYSDYYSNKDGKNPPPADYYNPTPIKFATVEDTTFRFAYFLKSEDLNKTALENKFKKLLTEYGLGAKTAIGMGYFEKIEDITQDVLNKVRINNLPPQKREKEELLRRIYKGDNLDSIYAHWQNNEQLKNDKVIAKKLKIRFEEEEKHLKKNGEKSSHYIDILKVLEE